MTARRAIYEWGRIPGAIWIVDLDYPNAASVTNDAERVIDDLVAAGADLARNRVVYRDSTGRWDELLVRGGQFAGFAPIGADSLVEVSRHIHGIQHCSPHHGLGDALGGNSP